jgi:hypothetical protein
MEYYKLKGSVTNQNKEALRQNKNRVVKILPDNKFLIVELEETEFEMEIPCDFSQTDFNKNLIEELLLKHCISILKYTSYLEIDKLKIIKSEYNLN